MSNPNPALESLPRRPLGRDGPPITLVGLGTWAIGGAGWAGGWGHQDDRDSVLTIRQAVASGIDWIDTAAAYGLGHSEEVVARALRDIPRASRPLVFTKCGRRWDPADRTAPLHTDLRPASIREECEASLRRLGADTIDLYQVHHPGDTTGTPLEESWGEMARLREEGKVRLIGASNFDLDQLGRCEAIAHIDSLQPPLSLVNQAALRELIPWCAEHGTGVIVYSPMRGGLLTERMTVERAAALPDDDIRSRNPDFHPPRLERNLAIRDSLVPVAARHGVSVGAIAVAWVLAQPGVTAAIVGGRQPEQVEDWLPAAGLRLSPQDLAAIDDDGPA